METNRTNGSAPQRDANGRFTSKSNGETHSSDFKAHTGDINAKGMESNADGKKCEQFEPSGQYIRITGAPDSLYLLAVFKAFREFFIDDFKRTYNAFATFESKVKSARELFPEDREKLYENVDNLRVHSNYAKYF